MRKSAGGSSSSGAALLSRRIRRYSYPEPYIHYFGEDYQPPDYLRQACEQALRHKRYITARLITVNDVYASDPHIVIGIDDFEDVIGKHFGQPKEGLGFDSSRGPYVAHVDLSAQFSLNGK